MIEETSCETAETLKVKPKAKTKGIVLIAIGFPDYGSMAFNLALSIKNNNPEINISIIVDDRALLNLNEQKKAIFDQIIFDKKEDYTHSSTGLLIPMKLKLMLHDYSPYDSTLYLDADIIGGKTTDWSKLFTSLKGSGFNIINEGWYEPNGEKKLKGKYSLWANYDEIVSAYATNGKFLQSKLFAFRSEVMYFEKSEKMKEFFDLALLINNNPKVFVEQIANGLPDEFCFNLASAILGIEPKDLNFNPIYWWFIKGEITTEQRKNILENYYGISIGGKLIPKSIKDFYIALSNYHHEKAGIKANWDLKEKKSFAPKTRAKI